MAIGTTAAIIGGSALLGAGASIIGGNKAAKAQRKAADAAAANERYFYDTTRADFAPWRSAGSTALDALLRLYGLGGSSGGGAAPGTVDPAAQRQWAESALSNIMPHIGPKRTAAAMRISDPMARLQYLQGVFHPGEQQTYNSWLSSNPAPTATPAPTGTPAAVDQYGGLKASPGYQFRLDEGLKAVERSHAARGLLRSGAGVKAVQRYGEGLAASEYDSYAARLAQLAGFGQAATGSTAQAGATAAGGISQALMASGNARASGYANTASSINSGINNMLGAYLMGGFGRGG